jgi:hypothetical protein
MNTPPSPIYSITLSCMLGCSLAFKLYSDRHIGFGTMLALLMGVSIVVGVGHGIITSMKIRKNK